MSHLLQSWQLDLRATLKPVDTTSVLSSLSLSLRFQLFLAAEILEVHELHFVQHPLSS